ncbi:MAG: hypothetical protein ACLGSD_01545 [Acidobacteriota bacterium]
MKSSQLIAIAAMVLLAPLQIARGEQSGSRLSRNQISVTNQDVIAMLKAGLSADIVAAKIKASECRCDTSPAALEQLKSAGVPDNVILAMVEVSKPEPEAPRGIAHIGDAKTAYLVNRSNDLRVFNELPKKLAEWGRWKLVDRPEEADIVLVLADSNIPLGVMSTASVNSYGGHSSGTGMTIPLMSFDRYLIAFDRATHRQLAAIDHQRTMTASFTAGALVKRMRKEVESQSKVPEPTQKSSSQ